MSVAWDTAVRHDHQHLDEARHGMDASNARNMKTAGSGWQAGVSRYSAASQYQHRSSLAENVTKLRLGAPILGQKVKNYINMSD